LRRKLQRSRRQMTSRRFGRARGRARATACIGKCGRYGRYTTAGGCGFPFLQVRASPRPADHAGALPFRVTIRAAGETRTDYAAAELGLILQAITSPTMTQVATLLAARKME